MEETWELAVVSKADVQGLDYWYQSATPEFLEAVNSSFSAEDIALRGLLDDYIQENFGYDSIPMLADDSDQPLFENSLFVLDIYQLVFTSIQFSLFSEIINDASQDDEGNLVASAEVGNLTYQLKALFALSTRLNHEIAAVRLLLLNDLTVQAVGRVRSYLECYWAFLLVCIEPKFAKEFIIASEPADQKHVFFKWLTKSKPQKRIRKYLEMQRGELETWDRLTQFSEEFIESLGAQVHPSFLSTLEVVFDDMEHLANADDFRLRSSALGSVQRFSAMCGWQIIILLCEFYVPLIEGVDFKSDASFKQLFSITSKIRPCVISLPILCSKYSILELSK